MNYKWTCPICNSNHDRDLNAAVNIKNFGQIDLYDQVVLSQETGELEEIPMSLQKFVNKIERSPIIIGVDEGSKKAAKSLASL